MAASIGLILSCVLFNFIVVIHGIDYTPEIQIQSGKIRGFVETLTNKAKVRKYLGIPFARANRFENPVSPQNWTGVKYMTSFGKVCYQFSPTIPFSEMSEDCLNLNIYAPEKQTNKSLPVMVWIHGGTFWFHSNRLFDGSLLATLGEVIFVAINYRLESFGFTHSKDYGFTGNYGLYDQLEALKWVSKNIAKFAGDPKKVTIIGNSAGANSVGFLTLTPLAKGLFKNAILQSGSTGMDILMQTYAKKDDFRKFAQSNWNCSDANMKSCLKSIKAPVLAKAYASTLPVVDGQFLPDSPKSLLQNGNFPNAVNTLIGVSADDGSCMTDTIPTLSNGNYHINKGYSREEFLTNTKNFGTALKVNSRVNFQESFHEAFIYRYTDRQNINDTYRNRRMFLDALTDSAFLAPAIAHANAFSNKGGKTFFYLTEHNVKMPNLTVPDWINGYHGTTKNMITGSSLKHNISSQDVHLSRQVMMMWSNFAKTSDPNKPNNPGKVQWPQYDPVNQSYLVIKPNMEVRSKPRVDYVDFWNVFLPALNLTVPDPCKPPGNSSSSGGSSNSSSSGGSNSSSSGGGGSNSSSSGGSSSSSSGGGGSSSSGGGGSSSSSSSSSSSGGSSSSSSSSSSSGGKAGGSKSGSNKNKGSNSGGVKPKIDLTKIQPKQRQRLNL